MLPFFALFSLSACQNSWNIKYFYYYHVKVFPLCNIFLVLWKSGACLPATQQLKSEKLTIFSGSADVSDVMMMI